MKFAIIGILAGSCGVAVVIATGSLAWGYAACFALLTINESLNK